MPKSPKHILEAQLQRKKIKEVQSRYVPGKVALQVLGTGAKGAPRSLYVFSDQARYLFNCGEGTQRLAHEHKMKLSKLEHIFITQPVWKNIGGLPGTALTIQDVGVPEITLHGPPGLDEIFVATKRFVVIRDLEILMAECNEETTFVDNVMSVRYVPIVKRELNIESSDEQSDSDAGGPSYIDSCVEATVDQSDASTSTRRKKRRRSKSRQNSQENIIDETDYYAHERKKKSSRHRSRSRSQSQSRSRSNSCDSGSRIAPRTSSENSQQILENIKEKGISMVYVCRLQPRPGALNLNKCVKKGITPGPILGKLKAGESVTLPDGSVITSKDVCEPDDPGPIFIVVDCPGEEYLDSLVNSDVLKKHQRFATCDEDVAAIVVHFTPEEVVNHPRYKEWIDDFSPSTQHLMLNEMASCTGSLAIHRVQHKLNLLSSNIFPLLGDTGTPIMNSERAGYPNKKQKCEKETSNVENESETQDMLDLTNLSVKSRSASPLDLYTIPNTFCMFHLRPRKGLDRSSELTLNSEEYIQEVSSLENFPKILQNLKKELNEKRKQLKINEYPKIVFLGTGSCIPNKTRNTSGILLKITDKESIILDCGEGTYGQMVRFFGKQKVDEELSKIKAVYISHLHADHHIGLIGLLQGRKNALKALNLERTSAYLFAPVQILTWLNFYDKCFESIREEFSLLPNGDFLYLSDTVQTSTGDILNQIGLSDLKTCLVRHCPNAFGVTFKDKNNHVITYSGDTMPSENLISLGKNSDVLIHEATMEDELKHEAVIKMHSTTSQAIEVGNQMKAKQILLTHFSQRYAKLPIFNENFSDNVSIAFDNMQISIDELPLVPIFYPALKLMFAEHYEEMEIKAVKRQLKLERERSASRERKMLNSVNNLKT